MRELSLHIMDIVENGLGAGAALVEVGVTESRKANRMEIRIRDDGRGIPAELLNVVTDPFYTTRTTRKVGLGIPLLKLAAEQAEGSFSLQSEPGYGTKVEAVFRHSNIDRMPLGDLSSTFLTALISHPAIHWIFGYRVTDKTGTSQEFVFDDAELKSELGDLSLTEPEILTFVRGMIEEGIESLAPQTVS